MAKKETVTGGARYTLAVSEMIALREILDKISSDKSLTTLHQYRLAGSFHQLFDPELPDGERRLHL